jgi:hypothetical protein
MFNVSLGLIPSPSSEAWRLGRLADALRDNRLASVGKFPKRDAEVDRHMPFGASIIQSALEGRDISGLGGNTAGRRRSLFWSRSRQTIHKASRTMWPDILE